MAVYTSKWKDKIDELAAQIQNRDPFQIDFNTDPMARNYRDQAIIGGKRAMEDTMARASAMTGGQLSSYSQAVGQQQYNRYMQDLLGKYMGLAQLAMERYDREGAELKDQLGYLQGQEAKDYDRWKDDQEWQHMLDREAIEDQRYADALAARGSGGGGGGGGGRGRGGGGGGGSYGDFDFDSALMEDTMFDDAPYDPGNIPVYGNFSKWDNPAYGIEHSMDLEDFLGPSVGREDFGQSSRPRPSYNFNTSPSTGLGANPWGGILSKPKPKPKPRPSYKPTHAEQSRWDAMNKHYANYGKKRR